MTTEMITLKLDSAFLKQIDSTVKKKHYHNRTEFIRAALREKIEREDLDTIKTHIEHMRGLWKDRPPISDEEYERNRQSVAQEISHKLKSSGR